MERDIFMKKAALFLTILCLVLFTVGCTSGSSTSRESYDTTGTVYSSQNTEDDDKDDEPKPMTSATQTPEPDICSVCNDEGYLDCEVCGHMGYTECDLCSGEGQRICPTCDGSQYRICGACDGAGGKKCISCNGTGIFGDEYTLIRGKCMMCGGSGTAQCAYCGGAGKEPCVCTGSGLIQCKNCHGDGGFLCTACQGEGRILCTNCQKKTEQPSGQTPGGGTGGNTGGTGWYDNGAYENPVPNQNQDCPYCVGGERECKVCRGSGTVKRLEAPPYYGGEDMGSQWVLEECSGCRGRGYTPCLYCNGQ